MKVIRASCIAALFVCALPGLAQQPGLTKWAVRAPAQTVETDRRVTLDVVVFDNSGRPVSNLQANDFAVSVDKRPQMLASFAAMDRNTGAASPLELVLVIDEINASFRTAAAARQGLKEFLRRDHGKLSFPTSLVIVSDKETIMSDRPTLDGSALIAELDRNATKTSTLDRSQAEHGANEQLRLSLAALERIIKRERANTGRKILVWISPGWPFMPRNAPEPALEWKRGMFNVLVELSDGLREARITLYAVNPTGVEGGLGTQAVHYKEFLKGVKAPEYVESGHFGLPLFAIQSGGLALDRSNDLARGIASCVADADSYYTVSFDAPEYRGPVQYQEIKVQVAKPGHTARTRTGYYIHPGSR